MKPPPPPIVSIKYLEPEASVVIPHVIPAELVMSVKPIDCEALDLFAVGLREGREHATEIARTTERLFMRERN